MSRAFLLRRPLRQASNLHCVEPSHSFVDEMGDDGSSAQRIRIGLTGLAFAFLLVLLASVISRSGEDEDPAGATADNVQANEAEPDEPLAKLGVAPGGNTVDNRAADDSQ